MSYLLGLVCRQCGRLIPAQPTSVCEECFAPLEPAYDYDAIRGRISPADWESRPANVWRYKELLPLVEAPRAALPVGCTPLLPARNLGRVLGHHNLFIKNDAVNFPTLSFKDRVVAVALNKALEFGFDTISCSSTGNLANAVAAQAAFAGMRAVIFVPSDLEEAKLVNTRIYGASLVRVNGNYDAVNRLCTQVSQRLRWAFVNVNLRPFYAEGSKTVGYEIAQQLGWRLPRAVVVPMAGGALIGRVQRAFDELGKIGFVDPAPVKIFGAQASGCAPIVRTVHEGRDHILPEKPNTIARSLAIGNPADGVFAAKAIRESGGWGAHVSDEEIVEGIQLLASTEGLFTETAGGVTVSSFRRLLAEGRSSPDELTVLCITGNGLKTTEAVIGKGGREFVIAPKIAEFERVVLAELAPPEKPVTVGDAASVGAGVAG